MRRVGHASVGVAASPSRRVARRAGRVVVVVGALSVAACSRGASPAAADASPAAVTSASPPPAPPSPPKPVAWTGKYDATPGTLFVPDGGEWSGVKFRGDDAGAGLGAGTLSVTIAPDGRAEGTSDGALGAGVVSGFLRDDAFSAQLVPKDPKSGFQGVLTGTREGGTIKGTMHLSSVPTGSTIREGGFSLEAAR